jgi:ferredoxin
MRVMIDWDLCVGSGLCAVESGGALRLVPCGGERRAVLAGCPDDGTLEAAARACPMLAIRLWDAAGRTIYPPPVRVGGGS